MKVLGPVDLAKLLSVCSQPTEQRTQQDIWYIRDRLHECSSFFRLWPAQEQQLICKLARPEQWVHNEVASQGSKPQDLFFIMSGQAAVAVRTTPSSSLLEDVATLQAGDTFGEGSLLGAVCQPAYVVVRSQRLLALGVNAEVLAEAMAGEPQGQQSTSSSAATLPYAMGSKHVEAVQMGSVKMQPKQKQQQQQQQLIVQVQQRLLRAAGNIQTSSPTNKHHGLVDGASGTTVADPATAEIIKPSSKVKQPPGVIAGGIQQKAQECMFPYQKQAECRTPGDVDQSSHTASNISQIKHHNCGDHQVADVLPYLAQGLQSCCDYVEDCAAKQPKKSTLYTSRHSSIFNAATTMANGGGR